MFKSVQQQIYKKVDQTITWQRMPYIVVLSVIFVVCIYAYILLKHAVSTTEYRHIIDISKQSQYPLTQHLANQLLDQPTIDKGGYFQLIRAYEAEHKNIKAYPPLDPNKVNK